MMHLHAASSTTIMLFAICTIIFELQHIFNDQPYLELIETLSKYIILIVLQKSYP